MDGLPGLDVVDPGLQTTVQDLGRPRQIPHGIPPSGAFDAFSLRVGNALVGNNFGDGPIIGVDPGAAGLEVLVKGPALVARRDLSVAVTGAASMPMINRRPAQAWQTLRLAAGDELDVGRCQGGTRAYVALGGGIAVPSVLGSRSTNVRARLGGIDGRPLRAGDVIGVSVATRDARARTLPHEARPRCGAPWTVRTVPGPHDELFEPGSVAAFFSDVWTVSPKSDRMGCRLYGPTLAFRPRPRYVEAQAGADPSNIVDDPIPVGGIQVPSGTEAIAMGVDGPTMGGYARIATVITADLSVLAQVRPGDAVQFAAVTVEQAVQARVAAERVVEQVANEFIDAGRGAL
jgi:biotin-dependent carboxylase-like uncharacterized protein